VRRMRPLAGRDAFGILGLPHAYTAGLIPRPMLRGRIAVRISGCMPAPLRRASRPRLQILDLLADSTIPAVLHESASGRPEINPEFPVDTIAVCYSRCIRSAIGQPKPSEPIDGRFPPSKSGAEN